MRFRLFYHSLVSDWNHGNAHFLRGITAELLARGHDVSVYEPEDGWSRANLERDHGAQAVQQFHRAFPHLKSETYAPQTVAVDDLVDDADVVIVHEWTEPSVLDRIAEHRTRQGNYCLLFHDTHHRVVSNPDALELTAIERCDGVLAFGESLAERYRRFGWGRRVFVWHEAADTRVFYPRSPDTIRGDVVWIGNWGDDERARELHEYLLEPVRRLRLRTRVHGVRYPPAALERLADAGVEYAGWLPNFRAPEVFAAFHATVHVPRRPYVELLPGIPTIRPFEAMASGIPLLSAPWDDVEGLFRGDEYVMVRNGEEMRAALQRVLADPEYREHLVANGLDSIRARHTCGHRVDQLLGIIREVQQHPSALLQEEVR
jgi:spore maturation protein CgeB